METSRALTLNQPWPWAILHLGKDVENRSWRTNHRGRLCIHAGQKYDREGAKWIEDRFGVKPPEPDELPKGCIVAIAELNDCIQNSDSSWAMPDCYHWVLSEIEPLPNPVKARGKQGIWIVDKEVDMSVAKTEGVKALESAIDRSLASEVAPSPQQNNFRSFEVLQNEWRIRRAIALQSTLEKVENELKDLSDKAQERAISDAFRQETGGELTMKGVYKEIDLAKRLTKDFGTNSQALEEDAIARISKRFSAKGLAEYCKLDEAERAGVFDLAREEWLTGKIVKQYANAYNARHCELIPDNIRDHVSSLEGITKTKYQQKLAGFVKNVKDMEDEYFEKIEQIAEELPVSDWDKFCFFLQDVESISKVENFSREGNLDEAQKGDLLEAVSECLKPDNSPAALGELCSALIAEQKAIGKAAAIQADVRQKTDAIYANTNSAHSPTRKLLFELERAGLAGDSVRVCLHDGDRRVFAKLSLLEEEPESGSKILNLAA